MAALSELSQIEIKDPSHPKSLFNEWLQEGKKYGASTSLMNLATASKNGKVGNRTVVIREVLTDGSLTFTSQRNSRKIKDITENPQIAATILLMYIKNGEAVNRQVRFTGIAEQLSKDQCKIYFDHEKLPAKIRSWICQEGGPSEWHTLKEKHDAVLKEVTENQKELQMPDTQVAYKLVPDEIDFYSSSGDAIADRVLFRRLGDKWEHGHFMA